jgi:Tol biopolymer transport system component
MFSKKYHALISLLLPINGLIILLSILITSFIISCKYNLRKKSPDYIGLAEKSYNKDFHFIKLQPKIKIIPLPELINSPFHDFSPTLTLKSNLLIFNSNRPGGIGETDLYECYWTDRGWSQPRNLNEINSDKLDETPYISPDGKLLLFSSNRKGGNLDSSDIYLSHRIKERWSKPKSLSQEINSVYAEKNPSLSPDGNFLLFTRHPVGNIRDARLMLSRKMDGIFRKPLTLPSPINEYAMDTCPVFHPSGKGIFFSSFRDGNSWDLYWLPFKNTWEEGSVVSLPFPVNTDANEAFFSVTNDGRTFYFSRLDRQGKDKENYNIYKVSFPDIMQVVQSTKVWGKSSDAREKELNWEVRVYDAEKSIPIRADFEALDYQGNFPGTNAGKKKFCIRV